jgi:transmembrane sensor
MMNTREDQVLARIAEQASEWFVANDEDPLPADLSAAFVAWLKASPLNVAEFLAVAAIARDLQAFRSDAKLLDEVITRTRAEDNSPVQPLWSQVRAVLHAPARWQKSALAAVAMVLAVSVGLRLWLGRVPVNRVAEAATAVEMRTAHGQRRDYLLRDGTVIHLNTDSVALIDSQRTRLRVQLQRGEAAFETVHDVRRTVVVEAGAARITDVGTQFNVRLTSAIAVVTVVEGQVAVSASDTRVAASAARPVVQLHANQQLSIGQGRWPVSPVQVVGARTTDWLRHELEFDNEPLGQVATEFNRYAVRRVEVIDPELRELRVSGVIATDDPQEFMAFLRSLDGVRVEPGADAISVSRR